jgi:hypothetical protein
MVGGGFSGLARQQIQSTLVDKDYQPYQVASAVHTPARIATRCTPRFASQSGWSPP